MKLYEISAGLLRIMRDIEDAEEAGNADAVALMFESIKELDEALDVKVCHIAGLRESLVAEADAIRAVIKRQAERVAAIEKRADWLEAYAIACLRQLKRTEVSTPEMRVQVKAGSGAVEVTDESLVPAEFWRDVPASKALSKADLREALLAKARNGEAPTLPGAKLIFKERLKVK